MRTHKISPEAYTCSTCSSLSLSLHTDHNSRRFSRQGGCIGTRPCKASTRKIRQKHQTATTAHAALVSQPLSIPEGDWLPQFISWLHANGASGVNQPGAKLALYEEEAEAGNSANRGVVFTEASTPRMSIGCTEQRPSPVGSDIRCLI